LPDIRTAGFVRMTCMRRSGRTALAALVLLAVMKPVAAHDFWIEPSSFAPAPGETVRVRLRVGQNFAGDPVPRDDESIDRFEIEGPSGRSPIEGADGFDPAGFAHVDGEGSRVLAYESRAGLVTLPAETFERYLRDEGLEVVVQRRAQSGTSAEEGSDRFHRCAKAIVVAGAASPGVPAKSGLTLEIVPRRDPTRLHAGDSLPVTLLFRGRPLAGALVKLLDKDAPGRVVSARTDGRGEVSVSLQADGGHLVEAVWMEAAPPGGEADWESWWASLTFATNAAP
jgi:hypothetical protein